MGSFKDVVDQVTYGKYDKGSPFYWRKNPYQLKASDDYWTLTDSEHKKICNGVGSRVGIIANLLWHFTPNTVWGLNITPVSDIHDYDFTYPKTFKTFSEAIKHKTQSDCRFRSNAFTLIESQTKWEWLKTLRKIRILKYHLIITELGLRSYRLTIVTGKQIGRAHV